MHVIGTFNVSCQLSPPKQCILVTCSVVTGSLFLHWKLCCLT